MENTWYTGINNFKKHTLNAGDNKTFTLELCDTEFEPNRDIDAIMFDHLANRQSKTVEILYSGGLDSEFTLASCMRNKIPVEAMTMVIKVRGAILNVVDLYYSEKFCRENNIKQNFFYLDAVDFYESGQYLEYLIPYGIVEPHVASHFWLLDKCQHFPVIGGDWPWVHAHRKSKIISPHKNDYCNYERYMNDNGISGVGNMIGYSLESCCYFIKKHLECYTPGVEGAATSAFLKFKMYGLAEPRLRSYGWETCPPELFNKLKYKAELLGRIGIIENKIVWGEQIAKIIQSEVRENSSFV